MTDTSRYAPFKLSEDFEGGEPLIPEGWTAFLWANWEDMEEQVHPSSVPEVGQIVALLCDHRVIPSDAYMTKMLNGLPPPEFKTGTSIEAILNKMFSVKTRIRQVVLARYQGLDSWGYPQFSNVGRGSENPSDTYKLTETFDQYAVAWKSIDIPYLPEVEI